MIERLKQATNELDTPPSPPCLLFDVVRLDRLIFFVRSVFLCIFACVCFILPRFCPRSFHTDCLEASSSSRGSNNSSGDDDDDDGRDDDGDGGDSAVPAAPAMPVCPQHRCLGCTKATVAAAGGLLFRCQTCAKAYCEDCLPEVEVRRKETSQ